ncbi:MAG TPA: glycosyltransferase family 4 protein, partial [Tepidisphaeraceae bacterium]|nr:glycosyltransferase family 4 protein [Tepidisphaeraceae bacterium]
MRILLVTHSPTLTTGYGRVAAELIRGFCAAGHEVVAQGQGYGGEGHGLPCRVVPWDEGNTVAAALAEHRPDVLLTVGDPWMFEGLDRLPRAAGVRWVAYFPVDGGPVPEGWKAWLRAVDVPVTFCEWTADLVRREAGVEARVITHGVDVGTFRPTDKAVAKRRVGVEGKFVVGCVAANQQRKNLPALVRAFAEFARGKEDVALYLHTRIDGYWDVEALVRRFGVEPKTRATLNLDPQRGVDDATLATVYNSFDVFALPTMAEGFGLPILEAQACGVPALATDCSACTELLPDPVQRIRVKDTLIMARNFEQAIADEGDLAGKLERLYGDRGLLAEVGRRSLAFARV